MRITGGQLRSRSLVAPKGDATRPTSDRVREALFAILLAKRALKGMRVLDLYAGTGALAFEALSRGAEHATLVERAKAALDCIRSNTRTLGLDSQVRILADTVDRAANALVSASTEPFDLVFADPPYALVANGDASRSIASYVRAGLLVADSEIIVEHASRDAAPSFPKINISGGESVQLTCGDTRKYGDTSLSFYSLCACDE